MKDWMNWLSSSDFIYKLDSSHMYEGDRSWGGGGVV